MTEPLAWLHGQFLPYSQATLALHDAGFVFGATITDYCRTFRRQLFRWSDHLARFRRDCGECGIELHSTDAELTHTAEHLIATNAAMLPPDGELAVITFATPGPLGYMIGSKEPTEPTLGMHTLPLSRKRYRAFFEHGVTLWEVAHLGSASLPRVKHRNRLVWWLADQHVRSRIPPDPPHTLPILSREGALLETAVGTLLMVRDGTVCCPDRRWILDGISLRVVEELCRESGIPFAESPFDPRRDSAEEAMLAGSAFCLVGVQAIHCEERGRIEFLHPGPVFQRLLDAWSDVVGVKIREWFFGFP